LGRIVASDATTESRRAIRRNPKNQIASFLAFKPKKLAISNLAPLQESTPVQWLGRFFTADAVIYGHSHQPKIETTNGTLFFNPGSAGPRRFRLPITVGRMTVEHGKLHAEIVELSVEK
jgi:predicted phosphodiesterase